MKIQNDWRLQEKRYLLGVAGVLDMSSRALSTERDGESLECSVVHVDMNSKF